MKITLLIFTFLIGANSAVSQSNFPNRCKGNWEGMMLIFQKGILRDSVKIIFSVTSESNNSWNWKTEYISDKFPMTKNYTMKMIDSSGNRFMIDEGNGINLFDYLFINKLYSVFETHGYLLTSTYELINDNELIFEVTSGRKIEGSPKDEVLNYSVESLQRVVLKRK